MTFPRLVRHFTSRLRGTSLAAHRLAALETLAQAVSNEINLRASLAAARESLLASQALARRSAPVTCRGAVPERRAAGPAAGRPVPDRGLRHLPPDPGWPGRSPVLRRADGGVRQIEARGPLLGFFPDIQLADVRFRLAPTPPCSRSASRPPRS
jgi:hypothetical protein